MIRIPIGDSIEEKRSGIVVEGNLRIPASAKGIIIFAHGSGSGRHSPRNQSVARKMVLLLYS